MSVATSLALLHHQLDQVVRRQGETDARLERLSERQQDLLVTLQRTAGAVPQQVREAVTDAMGELVRVDAFLPVQRIVYGLVGLVLVTMLGALLSLVIRSGGTP